MEVKVRGEGEDTDWSAEGHSECPQLLMWPPVLPSGGELCVWSSSQVPPLPALKVTVMEAPGTVALEQPFRLTCTVRNGRCEPSSLPPSYPQ